MTVHAAHLIPAGLSAQIVQRIDAVRREQHFRPLTAIELKLVGRRIADALYPALMQADPEF